MLGIDISDSITFDPAREAQYTAPLSLRAAYESLVTMSPGDYLEVKPALAKSWARTADGKGWRFTLADAKFNSGNPVTADDVKWTFDRLINLKDQPSQYVTNVSSINVVDPKTVDIMLVDPTQPILAILSGPNFGVMERKAVEAQGGTAAADANTTDKATQWLNQHSAGAGPFTMVGWTRGAQILLTRNEHYFRGPVQFEHVIVRHMGDSATQLLAIKRGDIGAAFNLIPEQIATLKGDKDVRVEGLRSLDYVYMALTNEPDLQQGAGGEGSAPGDRLRDRLRRDHQQPARRQGDALRQLHSDRAVSAPPRRRRSSTAGTRIWIARSSCCRRPASRTGSSSS